MNVRSLRFKLAVTNGLFFSVYFLLFGYGRYQTFSYRVNRAFTQSLEREAQFFIDRVRPTEDGFEWIQPYVPPADAMALDSIRPFFVLTDLEGNVLRKEFYGYYIRAMLLQRDLDNVLHHQAGVSDATASNGRQFRFINKIMSSESGRQVVLHLGRSLDQLNAVKQEYMLIYLYSVPLVLGIAAVVGWFFAAYALKPFEEVAKTAELITSEKLDTKIVNVRKEQEVQRLVESFNAMVARLRQSFAQMRRFNANVAHELRTPLAILQGENEIALRSESLPDEIRALLISNLEELERLNRIVNDILTLAEAEAGTQLLHKQPTRFNDLISDLADQMDVLAAERDIKIEVQELPDSVIDADPLWLRRAVLNLLDNAIKYSRDGGTIRIVMTHERDMVRLIIHDDGIGIAAKDLPFIFDWLFRADPARSRNTGGTGLGLSLVKWVIEAHDGSIHVFSAPDQGADFQVELPLMPRESQSALRDSADGKVKAKSFIQRQTL